MRTTLTLDDDVANRLEAERRKTGHSLKEVVNTLLRRGLQAPARKTRVRLRGARSLGLRAGINYSKTSDLLDWADGERE